MRGFEPPTSPATEGRSKPAELHPPSRYILSKSISFEMRLRVSGVKIWEVRGIAQMARALRLGRRGRAFKSHYPDQEPQ